MLFAIKMIDKKKVTEYKTENMMIREIQIHLKLNHPNIVKLYGFFHDEENVYLVQEYAGNQNLHQANKEKAKNCEKIKEKKVKNYIRQICSAVEYLQSSDILHRDLKLENVIVNKVPLLLNKHRTLPSCAISDVR